jgi:hypothetical protein
MTKKYSPKIKTTYNGQFVKWHGYWTPPELAAALDRQGYVPPPPDDDNSYFGFMAQDILKIYPEAVSIDKDGFMRVDYGLVVRAVEEPQSGMLGHAVPKFKG